MTPSNNDKLTISEQEFDAGFEFECLGERRNLRLHISLWKHARPAVGDEFTVRGTTYRIVYPITVKDEYDMLVTLVEV